MNRQAGPSIIVSVLIVCFFAVVLFPGDSRRSTASTPSDPISGPIVYGQPTAKPAPPTEPPSEKIVRSAPDSVAHPPEAAKRVSSGSLGKVPSTGVVATTKATP